MCALLAPRRALRPRRTEAEAALWLHLRGRRLAGFKFQRRHACGPFILGFYCAERRLGIEVDGGQQLAQRARYLEARGVTVLRFASSVVLRETEAVLTAIAFALAGQSGGQRADYDGGGPGATSFPMQMFKGEPMYSPKASIRTKPARR